MAAIARLSKQTPATLSSLAGATRSFASGNRQVRLRKDHKGRMRGLSCRGNTISFGDFALQALECSWITARQIEAGRRAVQRSAGKSGKVWVRLIADKSVTEKPIGTRMGSGKGAPQYTVAVVKPGRMLYEVGGVPENVARKAIALAAAKMPIRTAFRSRGICSVASDVDRQNQPVEELNHTRGQISGLSLAGVSPVLLPKLLEALDLNK